MLRSKSSPGSMSIPYTGGVFETSHDYSSRDDRLYSGPSSLWDETITSVVKTIEPLKISFPGGGGSYEIKTVEEFNFNDPIGCSVAYDINAILGNLGVADTLFASIDIFDDGGTSQARLAIARNSSDSSYKASVEITDATTHSGTTSVTKALSGSRGRLVINFDGANIDFHVVEGETVIPIYKTTFTVINNLKVRVACLSLYEAGSTTFNQFYMHPVLTWVDTASENNAPVFVNKTGNAYRWVAKTQYPATADVVAKYIGSADEILGEFSAVKPVTTAKDFGMVVSQVERFYEDGASILQCPAFAKADQDNIGDIVVANKCFNDGSARDNSTLTINSNGVGKYDQFGNRLTSPSFTLEDENGNKFGSSFEFLRVHGVDLQSPLANVSERLLFLRTKALSDGKILFYGVAGTPRTANQDIYAEIQFTYSSPQQADPLSDIDQFQWRILGFEDAVIYDSGDFSKSVIDATPALVNQWSGNLPPGKYALHIASKLQGRNDDLSQEGARIRAQVYEGTTSADPLLGKGYGECQEIRGVGSGDFPVHGSCYINFDIRERRGRVVAYIFNPASDSLTLYESGDLDVSLRTQSLGCIELDNGDLVFFYNKADDDDLLSHRSRSIAYKKLSGGVFGTVGTILLGSDRTGLSGVFAMDVAQNEDKVVIYTTNDKDIDYVYRRDPNTQGYLIMRERSIPFTPIGDNEVKWYSFQLDGLSFDGEGYVYNTLPDNELGHFQLVEMEKALYRDPDCVFDSPEPGYKPYASQKIAFLDMIRAEYDPERGVNVISGLDTNVRVPVVIMGLDRSYREIAIPFHFNMYNEWDFIGALFNTRNNRSLDSISATFGPDGMVYSLATKGTVVELGMIDPEFYWDNEFSIVSPDYSDSTSDIFNKTDFSFKAITSMSLGISYDSPKLVTADISRIYNYMFATTIMNTHAEHPLVWVNGRPDMIPFEVPDEQVWVPDIEGEHETYAVAGGTQEDYRYILQNTLAGGSVKAVMDKDNTYRFKYYMYDYGYRFHARIAVRNELTEPCEFYCHTHCNLQQPFFAGEARWKIDGTTVTAQVYDHVNSTWLDVGQETIVLGNVYDFYILIQKLGGSSTKFRAAFIMKYNPHFLDLYDGTHKMDYRTESAVFHKVGVVPGQADYAVSESEFGVYFRSNVTADRSEFVDVYQLGYCTLKGDEGMYEESGIDKDGDAIIQFNPKTLSGKNFRRFDDSILFNYNNEPQYGFRTFKLNNNDTTPEIHWYNGFKFRFSNGSSFTSDKWTLSRYVMNNVQNLLSKRLHGLFATANDDNQVTIWADSNDSELERFLADTFIVSGVNVPEIKVVGKDDILDPWTEIGDIVLDKYRIPNMTYEFDNYGVLTKDSATFNAGEFLEFPYYHYDDGAPTMSSKLSYSKDSTLKTEVSADNQATLYTGDVSVVYASRGFLKLDNPTSYRYIGFVFNPHSTHDGRFVMKTLDFGLWTQLDENFQANAGSGVTFDIKSKIYHTVDSQAYGEDNRKIIPKIALSYSILDAESYLKMLSVLDKISVTSRPIWVIPKAVENDKIYLTLVDGKPSHGLVVDGNAEVYGDNKRYYKMNISFKAVGD